MSNKLSNISESDLLSEVENFVFQILSEKYSFYNCDDMLTNIKGRFLALIYELSLMNIKYEYSQSILIFQDMLIHNDFSSAKLAIYREQLNQESQRIFKQANRKQRDLIDYITNLTSHYSKLLFVRIDLSYLKVCQNNIGILDMQSDMAKLSERIRNQDTCFDGLEGYAWSIEQGITKGYHCHLLLIYNGAKRQNDYFLSMMVGQTWQNITNNQGTFFLCNTTEYKNKFQQMGRLGVGMIKRDDNMAITNAINTACYLVNPEKNGQYLRAKPPNMRTFGKGVYRTKKRRGLPALEK